jgi:glutaredoxin
MSLITRPKPLPALDQMTVTLYTRAQCCCCQSAMEVLKAYEEAHGFTLEEVDASDPSLEDLIGPTVPVIAVDGKVRFRGEVNRVLFERLLEARQPSAIVAPRDRD